MYKDSVYFSKLKVFSSVVAPLTVGAGGSGTGVWWLLSPENKEARERLDEMRFDLTKSELIRNELVGESLRLKVQLDEIGKIKEEVTRELGTLREEKSRLEKEKAELDERHKKLSSDVEDLKNKQQQINEQLSSKDAELLEKARELGESKTQLEAKEQEVTKLEGEKRGLETEKQQLQQDKQRLSETNSSLGEKEKELEGKVEELTCKITNLNKEKQGLSEKVSRLENEINDRHKTIEERSGQIRTSSEDLSSANKTTLDLVKEKLELDKQLESKEQELKVLNLDFGQKQEEIKRKIAELEARIKEGEEKQKWIQKLEQVKTEQLRRINSLKDEIEQLTKDAQRKKEELNSKNSEIIQKSEEIQKNARVIEEKLKAIVDKSDEIEKLREQLRLQSLRLSYLYRSVLVNEISGYDYTDINIQKAVFNSFESGKQYANFSIRSKDGETVSDFKVKKTDKLFEYETLVEKAKNEGLNFTITQDKFNSWDKQLNLKLYDAGWPLNNSSHTKYDLDLKGIFKEEYVEKATKVLFLIEILDNTKASKTRDIWNVHNNGWAVSMPSGEWLYRSGWNRGESDGGKWNLWLKSFKTKDDFVKYWISKTYEFVTYDKVDFSELLQPMFQQSSYTQS